MKSRLLIRRARFAAAGVVFGFAAAWLGLGPSDSQAGNWPRFQGPDGSGHTAETDLPVEWNAESVIWKTALTGKGHSSPVVWGDRIFL
ncbi:MAG: hypothetical protein N2C14_20090, partial [Planctomycetales bacterium]